MFGYLRLETSKKSLIRKSFYDESVVGGADDRMDVALITEALKVFAELFVAGKGVGEVG